MAIVIVRRVGARKGTVTNMWDSVTENCRRVKGVWLCFGGGG